MAGRKQLPTKLKLMRGTARAHRLNPAEPMPTAGEPAPLESLTPAALAHFRQLTEKLSAVRVLTVNDGPALSALAQSLADYEEATVELAKPGAKVVKTEKGLVRSPWAVLQKQALDQMQRGFTDFGLTPSSRSKIVAAPKVADDVEEKFFGRA
jgi:P27 family predicted phage terminase small subunit